MDEIDKLSSPLDPQNMIDVLIPHLSEEYKKYFFVKITSAGNDQSHLRWILDNMKTAVDMSTLK